MARFIFAFALLAGLADTSWAGPKAPTLLAFQGVVVSFKDFGGRDIINGGPDIHYGVAKIRIVSPKQYKNRELTVMEETPVSPAAILRKVGKRISFRLQPGYLESSVLFSGALVGLKLVR